MARMNLGTKIVTLKKIGVLTKTQLDYVQNLKADKYGIIEGDRHHSFERLKEIIGLEHKNLFMTEIIDCSLYGVKPFEVYSYKKSGKDRYYVITDRTTQINCKPYPTILAYP